MDEQIQAQINLALAICAHDGLISDAEIASLQSHYCDSGRITESEMERLVDAFFEEEKTLEELLSLVDDVDYPTQILRVRELDHQRSFGVLSRHARNRNPSIELIGDS